jgi:hypothetical protein
MARLDELHKAAQLLLEIGEFDGHADDHLADFLNGDCTAALSCSSDRGQCRGGRWPSPVAEHARRCHACPAPLLRCPFDLGRDIEVKS